MVPGVWEEAPVESLEYVTDTPPEAPIPEMPQYIEFLPDTDWSIKGVHQGKVKHNGYMLSLPEEYCRRTDFFSN